MSPRFASYDWPGGREAMLRFGPEGAPTVLAALPLFEEANRTRASLIAVLRRLGAAGIASALPDLPGTGESPVATEAATLAGWRAAFAAAARILPGPVHVVAWRGGALVDAEAEVASRWFLSPVSGADVARDLRRVRAASGGALYAGNRLSDEILAELERLPSEGRSTVATGSVLGRHQVERAPRVQGPAGSWSDLMLLPPGSDLLRTVRLASDPRPADHKLPGRPLWRAAEPGTDPVLEAALADDITAWIARCGD